MGRDGLYVDIRDKFTVVRLCNTHLESLAAKPPLRPGQVELVSQYLHGQFVDAGVVAGDFNAIEGFDRILHVENDLKDAYLENGGVEGHEGGYTWGMQSGASGRYYGFSRIDKILYYGSIQIKNLARFGAGVKIGLGQGDGAVEAEDEDGDVSTQFVTDHLGLMADLHLERGGQNTPTQTAPRNIVGPSF